MITNLSLSAGEMPERLNLHGTGSIIVVAYFDLVDGRYENAKDYELNVNDNGVVTLTPCALAEKCKASRECPDCGKDFANCDCSF